MKLKNLLLPILGVILVILDMGFDTVNPILIEVGVPENWIGVLKTIFGVYGIYRIAKNKSIDLPTQSIGGTQAPPIKDEK